MTAAALSPPPRDRRPSRCSRPPPARLRAALRRLQFARASDLEPKAEPRRRIDPGRQHIVVIARPGDLAAADRTPFLLESHKIGQHLAGMRLLGEAVDDGNRGVRGHLLHVVLSEDSNDDRIDVARQHARGVGDGLAASQLHLRPVSMIASPPSSRIPTSNEMRVRVEGRSKIIASVLPASGRRQAPRP